MTPLKKSTRTINYLVVHCSATPEGKPFTVKDIDQWHRARGFKGIGYNYVIYLDGSVHEGRDVNLIPAHVEGHNRDSIGICYIGGCDASGKKPKDTRTPQQKAALLELLKALRKLYPNAQILGHRDFADVKKACPSFDAKTEYKQL
jgi:N-acetylmuramoyl-L-alanine amidase|nr:MAG TPA: endodeoxyribonuclease I [Caudoviricetes sp.]